MLEQPNTELMEHFRVKAIFQFTQVNKERLTKLAQWVDQNNIRVNVEKTFSLDEAGKALDYQKDVHHCFSHFLSFYEIASSGWVTPALGSKALTLRGEKSVFLGHGP